MLTGLSIRNFLLIEAHDLAFTPGLTVLTGETGAGKSILLDALGAACGARAEAGLVRPGTDKATVTAGFSLPAAHPVRALLAANELETGDGELILRRIISSDGRSKAFVNDQPVGVSLLRQIGDQLVEVHGQFDTHGLLDPTTHGLALDRFGQHDATAVAAAWSDWQAAGKAEAAARADLARAQAEEESLREAVEDLRKLGPHAGEEEKLIGQKQLLQNKGKLAEAFALAYGALADEKGAEESLTTASKALAKVSVQAGERAGQALAQLDAARDAVAEAQSLLESLQDDLGAEGLSLEQVEDRLYELRATARRHGVTIGELPELAEKLIGQLALLSRGEDLLTKLTSATGKAKAAYEKLAAALSAERQKSARKLEKAIMAELIPLKLERAIFSVALTPAEPGPRGIDAIQFMVTTNPGSPAGPLDKIASGGELARFMLALKVVLADTTDAGTLIFDEVDQGVGGAVASAVGERLARLGRDVQVLVVTHAPQVAAKGHTHLRVSKAVIGKTTQTSIEMLDSAARKEEIARMLSGSMITEASRQAASELLTGAA